MYKLQLIRKYLFKRRIAWVALLAVMLCTAMVLVVISVMGGWLTAFKGSFHGMTGDVVITGPSLAGFPEYQEMIDQIMKLPSHDAVAALPVMRTGALININGQKVEMVQVLGYPTNIGQVNNWPDSLHQSISDRTKALQTAAAQPGISGEDRARFEAAIPQVPFSQLPDVEHDWPMKHGPDPRGRPGMVVSSALVNILRTTSAQAALRRANMVYYPVSLTLVPVKEGEPLSLQKVQPVAFWIVDDSKSQVWQLDSTTVYIAFDEAQKDLGMDGQDGSPKRCHEIQIKARPGLDLNTLRDEVQDIVEKVGSEHGFPPEYCSVETWVQQQGVFIKAVEKEVVLTTALFGIISSVAVLLIFCIFYMIVIEKTKDIGIIKSVGATGAGILTLFLGYGLAIGVVGAGLGFGAAYLIVWRINELHAWLGRQMGIVIFTPETYQLEKIPNQMEPRTVVWVLICAVLSALLGALIPALRAAIMNPVDALRYE